jgi:hypothetical protein
MRGVHSAACMRFIRYCSREGTWDAHHYWAEPSPCSCRRRLLSSSRRVVRSNALSDPVIGATSPSHPRALVRSQAVDLLRARQALGMELTVATSLSPTAGRPAIILQASQGC